MHTDTASETTFFNIPNYLYTTYITAQAHATQETKPNTDAQAFIITPCKRLSTIIILD
jgi:hypothetical protein